jgi:hypothetical protein
MAGGVILGYEFQENQGMASAIPCHMGSSAPAYEQQFFKVVP